MFIEVTDMENGPSTRINVDNIVLYEPTDGERTMFRMTAGDVIIADEQPEEIDALIEREANRLRIKSIKTASLMAEVEAAAKVEDLFKLAEKGFSDAKQAKSDV